MADDDDYGEFIEYGVSRFGTFGVRLPEKKRKRRAGDKRVPPRPKAEQAVGSGAPPGRALIRDRK